MTILVVDDQAESRSQLGALLRDNGCRVVEVSTGAEALAAARLETPHLIISAIAVAGTDDFALCREWQRDALLRAVPFVFYAPTDTGRAEPGDLLQTLREIVAAAGPAPTTSAGPAYRLLFESSLDAVLLTVPDGRILAANPAACLMFGRSEDELTRLGREALVDASDPRLLSAIDERSRTGRFRGELTFVRRDGSRFPGELASAVFRTPEGETRNSMIIRDVTERRLAHEALSQSEALLDQVSAVARIGGWEMDLLTRTARWTRGTYDIVEIEPGELIPGPDEHVSYYLPEYRRAVAESMRALIEEDRPLDFEAQLRTAKGKVKWCHATGRAVRQQDRCIRVYGILQDVTERHRAEQAIQDQLTELQRWHAATLGREGRVLELKKEVNALLGRIGQPPKYASVEDDA